MPASGAYNSSDELLRVNVQGIYEIRVPSYEEAGMMWSIREEDLRNRRFDRIWMILQCY